MILNYFKGGKNLKSDEKKSKKISLFTFIVLAVSILFYSTECNAQSIENNVKNGNVGESKQEYGLNNSIDKIVETAPKGLRTDGIFNIPNISKNGYNNMAKIITNQNTNTDIVFITQNTKNQLGAIWSDKNYKLNINKNFHMSMKMYFGTQGDDAADGMTFTIHNPGKNNNAYDENGQAQVIGDPGGSLGVMGRAIEKKDKPWEQSVQNSFTIEFDSHLNSKGLDRGIYGQNHNNGFHIADYYPAKKDSYESSAIGPALFHGDAIVYQKGSSPADGQWHDFSINYIAKTHELSYTFDDKTKNTILDTKSLNPTTAENNSLMFWGFTGSTGSQSSPQAVVFTELPDLGDIKSTASAIKDGKAIDESPNESKNSIYSSDELTYKYELLYPKTGHQPTGNISVDIKLDDMIDVSDIKDNIKIQYDSNPVTVVTSDNVDIINHHLIIKNIESMGPDTNGGYHQKVDLLIPILVDKESKLTEKKEIHDEFNVITDNGIPYNSQSKNTVDYYVFPNKVNLDIKQPTDLQRELQENENDNGNSLLPNAEHPETLSLQGKIKTKGNIDISSLKVHISGEGMLDKDSHRIELDTAINDDGKFNIPLDKQIGVHLLAGKSLEYVVYMNDKVLCKKNVIVLDATPPSGKLKSEFYTVLNKVPEAEKLVASVYDTNEMNQNVTITYGENSDIKSEVKIPSKLDENHHFEKKKVEIHLVDATGNESVVTQDELVVVKEQTWIEGGNVNFTSKELLKNSSAVPSIIKERERISDIDLLKKIEDKSEFKAYNVSESGQLEDVSDKLQFLGLEKIGYQPNSEGYPFEVTIKGKLNTNVVSRRFLLKVNDGDLKLKIDSLDYKPEISTIFKKEYLPIGKPKLNVLDNRFANDGWNLSIEADNFKSDNKKIDLNRLDLVINRDGIQRSIISQPIVISNNSQKNLDDLLSDERSDNAIYLVVSTGLSGVKKKDTFQTNINWQLTPIDDTSIQSINYVLPLKETN